MSGTNTVGRLKLTHTVTVDKVDAATGATVGQVTQTNEIEGPDALAMFNSVRAAQGLPPLTEAQAWQLIQQQQEGR
jgi:hypothetical protein